MKVASWSPEPAPPSLGEGGVHGRQGGEGCATRAMGYQADARRYEEPRPLRVQAKGGGRAEGDGGVGTCPQGRPVATTAGRRARAQSRAAGGRGGEAGVGRITYGQPKTAGTAMFLSVLSEPSHPSPHFSRWPRKRQVLFMWHPEGANPKSPRRQPPQAVHQLVLQRGAPTGAGWGRARRITKTSRALASIGGCAQSCGRPSAATFPLLPPPPPPHSGPT